MTAESDAPSEAARKVLLANACALGPGVQEIPAPAIGGGGRLQTDDKNAADDLVRLVLALVETVRQLMERQAIRRVESGSLSDDEIERLGLTLMRLEERMDELKIHFGIADDDLSLRLGTVQDLLDVLDENDLSRG